MLPRKHLRYCLYLFCTILTSGALSQTNSPRIPERLEILFLGHHSKHHDSEKLADILLREYFKDGINITYTADVNALNDSTLAPYDGLIVYANHDSISPSQEQALINFVENGKGFIPLHSASHCFRNSPEIVEMIGGQFSGHAYDSFPALIVKADHPVMQNVKPFSTRDETYVHQRLSRHIEVLTERQDGDRREPYTWVRPYGKGRVFYTAYGHDEHTFYNAGFLQVVKNGILWAVGEERKASLAKLDLASPKYFPGPVPNYEKRNPPPSVQEALTPAGSMSQMQIPVGFELQLFAAEPDVINPIFSTWDERGRLWVIETVDYPNEIKDDDEGDDRIKILEDTDGDGRADKFTVFADKLNIPTSLVFVNGGIIVSAAPSFLFLKDTDGDDKADLRQTLLHGWGKFDTHAQASNLRYGLDNMIWGVVGYSGFRGKSGADSVLFSNGLFRFSRDGKQIEHLSTTSNNTWGLGFSEDFDVFISTANNTHSGFFGIPKKFLDKGGITESGVKKIDAHYNMHVATKNLRQVDVHGGFTAAAGHSLYTARNFPKEYWNRIAFVTEPTGRVVHRAILRKDGAGFTEDGDGWNILTSADEWVGPVQAEVGPDGALWITDWYDFIIQHNPTPNLEKAGLDARNGEGNAYINPLRDHERGRIYRLSYKNNLRNAPPVLNINDVPGLVKALSHDNMFWRTTAQRLLVEKRDLSILPDLYDLIKDSSLDAIGINAPAVHALWTLHGLGALDGTNKEALRVTTAALRHPSGGVRRAAVQVLSRTPDVYASLVKANSFHDNDLRVRLAAILAVSDMKPSSAVAGTIIEAARKKENTGDYWIAQALAIAARSHTPYYRSLLKNRGLTGDTTLTKLAAATKPVNNSAKTAVKTDQTIVIKVVKDVMKFDKELITAKAGTTISIVLENPDFMQHNLVLIKPNTTEKVGAAADRLAQQADGAKKNYIPDMPEVLKATPLVNPGGKYTLTVKLPVTPGDYPYICTFPGHWRLMKGILRVTK